MLTGWLGDRYGALLKSCMDSIQSSDLDGVEAALGAFKVDFLYLAYRRNGYLDSGNPPGDFTLVSDYVSQELYDLSSERSYVVSRWG